MEQKAKKYSELNKYERAMTNASLEQRLEAMARDLQQVALALGISIHVDSTFHNWGDEPHTSANVAFIGKSVTQREVKEEGSLLGIIEDALGAKESPATD